MAFVGMDLSQIEARATFWCAGSAGLDLFRTGDPYCTYGSKLFGHEITKKDLIKRTASKASVLGNGFGGGIGAGQRTGDQYNLDFGILADIIMPTATYAEMAEADRNEKYYQEKMPLKPLSRRNAMAVDIAKQRYRADFWEIPVYWKLLEQCFLQGGQAGPVHIEVRAGGLRVVTLPSGRQMFYHGVKQMADGSYCYRRGKKVVWLWYGQLMENVAQAINEDISCWYKIRANKIAPVVHHVYDEFTLECEARKTEDVMKRLKELTQTEPSYVPGLPLGFDFWEGNRYGK